MEQIFHIMNRGVDKRKVFMDDCDRFRFIHDLYEFNDENRVSNLNYFLTQKGNRQANPGGTLSRDKPPRKLLVDIYAYCLMPNHYHLLLSPRSEMAVAKFMKKMNMGYAKYFNEKYKRAGALFQGKYKSIQILDDSHLLHLPYYIHLNPLDLNMPDWRKKELPGGTAIALDFLRNYRWSSHLDYSGLKNFPSLISPNFLASIIGTGKEYTQNITSWLKELEPESMGAKEFLD